MGDVKEETLSTIKEWKDFLDFLEGFSLEKEIDDKAEGIRKLTTKLETLISSPAADDELYEDTLVPEAKPAPATPSDTYEIQDFEPKPVKKSSTKSKSAKKRGGSESKDDESQSSGGSLKEFNENIPDVTWEIIAQAKECPISGRLTKRSNPASSGLFKSNPKVYAGIYKHIFYWFDKPGSKRQKGAFRIADYTASAYVNEKQKKAKQKEFIFQMECTRRPTYFFSTQTETPMQQWIDMFNKLAKGAKEEEGKEADKEEEVVTEADDDLYEETDAVTTDKIDEVGQDEDVYEDPGNVERKGDKVPVSAPPLPSRDTSPPPVTMRDKPTPPPSVPDDEIYDDGTSAPLPDPPRSWIEDADDQELYTDAESAEAARQQQSPLPVDIQQDAKKALPKFETLFYGLWDNKPSTDEELEFHHGDKIEILERRYDGEGWWVGLLNGRVGIVPKNFLTPVYRKI